MPTTIVFLRLSVQADLNPRNLIYTYAKRKEKKKKPNAAETQRPEEVTYLDSCTS